MLVVRFVVFLAATAAALAPRHGPSVTSRRNLIAGGLVLVSNAAPIVALAVDGEEKSESEKEEEARLKRKLAAQEAAGAQEGQRSFAKDLAEERAKEKARKSKTKAEQREDLCELLGRGC